MRVLLGLLKVLTGVSLAIAILFFSGMYAVRYAMTRLTTLPERPVFPEETATAETVVPGVAADNLGDGDAAPSGTAGITSETPTTDVEASATESSPDEPQTAIEEVLEPGAYRARVVQPIGLVLRQGPNTSTIQLGGVAYNEELIVLSESSDGDWINVRLPGSDVEGWVKNGNTEPLGE
ncbi:MAG: SH3 domain-containing protein [Cyanothece sp. SIO2G6]|nr:SH3 domain-containing protein [Cyanothece sp. SIO2G6]